MTQTFNISRWLVLFIDLLIVLFATTMGYFLRFNFHIPTLEINLMYIALGVAVALRCGIFLLYKTYTGIIFHTSIEDAKNIFSAVATGTLVLGVTNFVLAHYLGYYLMPHSVVFIEFLVTIFVMTGLRIFIKIVYFEYYNAKKNAKSIIIYGVDDNALITKKTFAHDRTTNYNIVAFIANTKQFKGQYLDGVAVYDSAQLPQLLAANPQLDAVVLTAHRPDAAQQAAIDICLAQNVAVRTVPPAERWINGELSAKQIRDIGIDDLLVREPIVLDTQSIQIEVRGKVVLVTGAAGSIGSEIARQLIAFEPKLLVLLDQAETPLYEIDIELREHLRYNNFEIVVGDVRSEARMERVFAHFKPEVVYHAAAYKHVPLMELNPVEAVRTNALGTQILADISVKYGVEKFVFVSTDKAVNPTNVMGASKRVAEMYVQSLNESLVINQIKKPRFVTTRFGNVLGSNGSVIPLFKKQIASGGPLTVTHPDITRFFMTIPEACQLVLEAGAIGEGGEIFVFDMGASVKIIDLAKNMIRLSGLTLGKDIEIKYTGLRPGEKLYEELLTDAETTLPTHHQKIMIAKVQAANFEFIKTAFIEIKTLVNQQNNRDLVQAIKHLVPEYKSNNSEYEDLD